MTTNQAIEMVPVEDIDLTETEEEWKPFKSKIHDDWMPQILEWSAAGFSLSKLVINIKKTFNVNISKTGIRNRLKQVQFDRATESKAVVRENIGQFIVNDLQIIHQKKAELVLLSQQFMKAKEWKEYYQAIDRIHTYSKTLFELSGVNESPQAEAENAKADLIRKLEETQYASRQSRGLKSNE